MWSSGSAIVVGLRTGETLVWGLWRQYLVAPLLWVHTKQMHRPRINAVWRAPSWSWAQHDISILHVIDMPLEGEEEAFAVVENIDVDASPYGESFYASLDLRGRLVHATMNLSPEKSSLPAKDVLFELEGITVPTLQHGSRTRLKYPYREQQFTAHVVCIALYRDSSEDGYYLRNDNIGVLILQQDSSQPIRHKRLGVLLVEDAGSEFYLSQESFEYHTISMI
jgi:hypothetical protein